MNVPLKITLYRRIILEMKKVLRKITAVAFAFAIAAGILGFSTQTYAKTIKKKPTVVIVRADWCRACQKVEPIMMSLMKKYRGKLNFVIFDVTDEAAEAISYKKAKAMGLASFFNTYKKKTSTVAVFNGRKKVFQTVKNYSRSSYVIAFNKAIK